MNDRRLGTVDRDAVHASRRTAKKREQMIDIAMRYFAEYGYQGARVEDMASELGIAKGSFFQYFGSKEALFFAAYEKCKRRSKTDPPLG